MKRLIICSDGTWQKLSTPYPTNVAKITQSIKPVGDDGVSQMVFYGEGLGTGDGFDRVTGGVFGWGIDKNIQDAYRFLCLNYEPKDENGKEDEIYLFGFSRGAYTVRSLVGLIRCVGLLPREGIRKIPRAYEMYQQVKNDLAKQGDAIDRSRSLRENQAFEQYRETFRDEFGPRYHEDVTITLLGCWDTVGSLGIPDQIPWFPLDELLNRKYQFHNTTLSSKIKHALHALAIDENRKEFRNTEMQPADPNHPEQVKEVWFPGGHGCAGGGTEENSPLSNAALLWMIEEVEALGGLTFDRNRIEAGIATDATVYFSNELGFPFTEYVRPIPDNAYLHATVLERWNSCPWYRPNKLQSRLPNNPVVISDVRLAVGDSQQFVVFADKSENETPIYLEQGGTYRIIVSLQQSWWDAQIVCTAAGWCVQDLADREVPFPGQCKLLEIAEPLRHLPNANWMQLIVTVRDSDPDQQFPIGLKGEFVAPVNGRLIAFANDVPGFYHNNKGWVFATITRLN